MPKLKATIKGIRELQRANLKSIRALQPTGAAGQAVQSGILAMQRYQATITDVDTGALKGSRRIRIEGMGASLFTSHTARNPRSGTPVLEYDDYEEARGGGHANWSRTFNEAGARVASTMMARILRTP